MAEGSIGASVATILLDQKQRYDVVRLLGARALVIVPKKLAAFLLQS